MRIGELLYESINKMHLRNGQQFGDIDIAFSLHYMPDTDLIRIVKDYLAERKTKESVEEK